MSKMNKVVEYVEDHKAQVALAAGTVVGIAIWAITRDKANNYVDINQPALFTGEWTMLQKGIKGKYEGCITGCAKAVDITDLGRFGDAVATIEGIDAREPIRIIFGTEKSFN